MDIGLHIADFSFPDAPASIPGVLGDIAEAAEMVGVAHLSVMDHYFQMEMLGGPEKEMLEGYTTLGYLAAKTERLGIGMLVTGVTYRHPGLLAKIVTTLDVLSGGRARLGIGAAWYEREHAGLGVPFPSVSERYERLEETLQICLQMWSDDNGPYEGKHYQLAETLNLPQSIQRPHPPILIGGQGEKKTLRLVAQYADACNLFTSAGPDGVRHKLDVLRRHCDNVGTDYDAIRKTALYAQRFPARDAADAFVEEMSVYAGLGIETIILMPPPDDPVGAAHWLGQVEPGLAEL